MAGDNDDVFDISRAQISDAALDYSPIPKGQQGLEGAHAARAAGGEENCSDLIHPKKITTKTRRHKEFKLEMLETFLVT